VSIRQVTNQTVRQVKVSLPECMFQLLREKVDDRLVTLKTADANANASARATAAQAAGPI